VLLFDAKTGKLRHAWPDSGKSMEGYGRGLLAGELIYWPTKNEIQVLDQRTALRAEPPIKLVEAFHTQGGNLVAGDGYLIVAQADGMVVFCQNSRLIERYTGEIARAPDRAANYFRLARAAEAIGRDQLALDTYRQAAAKARSGETIDGVSLVEATRDHRFRLLLRLAGSARKARSWDEASNHLDQAAAVAGSDPERLQAQLRRVDVLLDAARPAAAVDICERLLNDQGLRSLPVVAPDGHRTIRADLFIADRLHTIVRDRGRGVYDSYDREAAKLFDRAREEKDARLLDEVCRAFPEAHVVPDALLILGSLHDAARRYSDAAHTYKRLILIAPDDEHRALAILRLAHTYEARRLFVAARDSYLELQARFPSVHLQGPGPSGTVAEIVASELARAPYPQLVADRPAPATPIPLMRRWHWQAPANQPARIISAHGVAPSLEAGRLFLLEKTGLRMLDPSTGMPRWSSELGATPIWAGYLADKLIVATSHQLAALELGQGTVQWRYDLSRTGKNSDRPDPFAQAQDAEGGPRRDRPAEALSGFHLVKQRVYCLRGTTELLAIDGDTGALDWSFSPPTGVINSNLWIGADRTVLEVEKPNLLLVLRTDDGQPMSRTTLEENERLERPPLPVDEDSVVLVSDRRTVKRFDMKTGQTVWVYQESADLPVNGPPRVIGDCERLLVLHDGRLLIRLDPATGSKQWSTLLGIENLSERPGSMAYDENRFYCVNMENIYGGLLQSIRAVSLKDGSKVWSRHLSGPKDAPWSLALTQHHVIAYPTASSADGGDIENMPVIIRRRESGELVQRLVFATTIADVTLRPDARGVLLATSRGLWGLGSKDSSSGLLSERGR
jgi:outer membrane protein assembly factor BamB/tetratricopeptide (TPR) repeat protein